MQDALYASKVEVPVKAFTGTLYVRISAFVYNELEDYQALADAVSSLKPRAS